MPPPPNAGVLEPAAAEKLDSCKKEIIKAAASLLPDTVQLIASYLYTPFRCQPTCVDGSVDSLFVGDYSYAYNPNSLLAISNERVVYGFDRNFYGVWDTKNAPLYYCTHNHAKAPFLLDDGKFVTYSIESICVWHIVDDKAHCKWFFLEEDEKGCCVSHVDTVVVGVIDPRDANTDHLPDLTEREHACEVYAAIAVNTTQLAVHCKGRLYILDIINVTARWSKHINFSAGCDAISYCDVMVRLQLLPSSAEPPAYIYVSYFKIAYHSNKGSLVRVSDLSRTSAPYFKKIIPLTKPDHFLVTYDDNSIGIWCATENGRALANLPPALRYDQYPHFWVFDGKLCLDPNWTDARRNECTYVNEEQEAKIVQLLNSVTPLKKEFSCKWGKESAVEFQRAIVSVNNDVLEVRDIELGCVLMRTPRSRRQYFRVAVVGDAVVAQANSGHLTLFH